MWNRRTIHPSPLAPLASLAAIGFDLSVLVVNISQGPMGQLWTVMVAGGVLAVFATLLAQAASVDEAFWVSAAKALTVGLAVVIPLPIAGTVLGLMTLAWSGVHYWLGAPPSSPAG